MQNFTLIAQKTTLVYPLTLSSKSHNENKKNKKIWLGYGHNHMKC